MAMFVLEIYVITAVTDNIAPISYNRIIILGNPLILL